MNKLFRGMVLAATAGLAGQATALTIDPTFSAFYTATDLGSISGLPTNYGGLTFKAGDTNTILIGGAANSSSGLIYEVGVTRGAGSHITGFTGAPTTMGSVGEYNDGGVTYGPGGVLFTSQWPVNKLGQTKPGSIDEDKIIDLAALGVAGSHAAINFVPSGFAGAGQMKLASWSGGQWYTAAFSPDGSGTYDITSATFVLSIGGGPEVFVYIDGINPGFGVDSLLVSEYSAGKIAAYGIDSNGDPILASRQDFITGLTGAEGAAIDPVTGDFVFSTFGGGNRLVVVSGFRPPSPPGNGTVPEPMTLLLFGSGLIGMATLRRKQPQS